MGLVFVHGIGNRSGPGYGKKVALRDALFRRYLLARALPELEGLAIRNPMWGDLGASLAWNHASSITGPISERFGSEDSSAADLLAVTDPDGTGTPLVNVARRDLYDAIDLLYTLVDVRGRDNAEIEDLADMAVALTDWCDQRSGTDALSLDGVSDDLELVEILCGQTTPQRAASVESLGSRRRLHEAARVVLAAAIDRYRGHNIGGPARIAAAGARRLAGRPISLLIGDVLAYLGSRGEPAAPGPIVALVARMFEDASREGPLVVVAHSMGGNIAYDIVSHFRPDLEVDTLITVGSQVGLFEELKLFGASDPRLPLHPGQRVPALPNVRHWLNVVDRTDVLAYVAEPIFHNVVDYEYPSDAVWAHGAYFRQPSFHARLAARVHEVRGKLP
ncbi:hypothetical protein ABZS66_43730 [Dactylosporangium sp. NPDC005572]|uniref:hypothetical protein n=1 Tax=Dactylosporangium sp. NPDC005572 TaxID=3156889 RepID=UPI0033A123F7